MAAHRSLAALSLACSILFLGAACGGTSTASSGGWTDDFCRAAAEWDDALASAQETIAGTPQQETIVDATAEVRRATNAFAARVQELGVPDLDSAAPISRELTDLAEGLDTNVVAIEQTVNGSFYSEATATATFDVSVAFMGHLFDATLSRMLDADRSGILAADYADTPSCQALGRSPG